MGVMAAKGLLHNPHRLRTRASQPDEVYWLVGWLVRFYGISTFVGYLILNPFLYK